jgi:ATP-binding cassette, subfamily F, member 3
MLDEPTNHLDMHSCDLLIEALNKYQGSIILVSHDRYFVSKTANKIWEIVDHKVKEFKGGYEEYVAWKERMAKQEKVQGTRDKEQEGKSRKSEVASSTTPTAKQEAKKPEQSKKTNEPDPVIQPNNKPVSAVPINKELKKELQKQQKIFQQLEEQIAQLNKKKTQLEAALVDPQIYSDKNKFLQAEADYKKAEEELVKLNLQYEKTFELIVSLEGN